jgi:ribosome-associated toxin RatA of RatAB toxin-antitoxin module
MNKSKNITKTGFLVWAIALLTFLGAVPVFAVDFSTAEKVKLKKGRTVIKMLPTSGQKGFYGGSGYALIDAPVDEVWKILLDFELYTRMFPNTEVCTPISRKGNKTLVKMKIGHPVVNVRYHVETTANESEKSLHFKLLNDYPHDIDSLTGYWRLFPQSGNRTLAAYVVSVKAPPGIVAIAGDDLANRAVMALLKIPGDIKRWVERRKKQQSGNK